MSYGSGSAVVDGQLRIFNGESYDPVSDTWSTFSPIQGFVGPPSDATVTAVGMALLLLAGPGLQECSDNVISYETCMAGCLPACCQVCGGRDHRIR